MYLHGENTYFTHAWVCVHLCLCTCVSFLVLYIQNQLLLILYNHTNIVLFLQYSMYTVGYREQFRVGLYETF